MKIIQAILRAKFLFQALFSLSLIVFMPVSIAYFEDFSPKLEIVEQKTDSKQNTFISEEQNSSFDFTMISGEWKENSKGKSKIEIQLQLKINEKWSDWQTLEVDEEGDLKTSVLLTNPSNAFRYKFIIHADKEVPYISDLKWTLINSKNESETKLNPDNSSRIKANASFILENSVNVSANIPQAETKEVSSKSSSPLKIISRSEWGADEKLRLLSVNNPTNTIVVPIDDSYLKEFEAELKYSKTITSNNNGESYTWSLQYPQKVSKFVIHHTATVNNLDNPKQAIRDIYYYHSVSRGWGDIGYNYIIDQEGNIYEGRFGGESVVGAHAGKANTGSIGISILGNYDENEVPKKAIDALTALIAEKSKVHNIDPAGKSMFRGTVSNTVLGHKDVMATVCPGRYLYARLPVIAQTAKSQMKSKTLGDSKFGFSRAGDFSQIMLDTDQEKTFKLSIKNEGSEVWDKETYILYSQNTFLNSIAEFPDKRGVVLAKMNEQTVRKGQTATFNIRALPKEKTGTSIMQIHLMANGKNKIEDSLDIPVINAEKVYDYELISITEVPKTMTRNQRLQITVKLKNTGNLTWYNTGNNAVNLGSDTPRDSLSRFTRPPKNRLATMQTPIVKPGEIATFKFTIIAPVRAGTYSQTITPVVEGKSWMPNKNINFKTKILPPNLPNTIQNPEKPSSTPSKEKNTEIFKKQTDNIRIKLSVFNEESAIISSNRNFATYKGNTKLKEFEAGELVVIREAGIKVVAINNGILEITNLENRPAWNTSLNDNRYRGSLEFQMENEKLIAINELPLEEYLKGLGEVGNGEPVEKIKTIIVSARTYAKFYMEIDRKFPGKNYDLDDDPNVSQRYLGYGFEERASKVVKAVVDTKGEVVTYKGKLIKTPYFSSTDGTFTISAKDKWNWNDTPYLQSVDDSHCKQTAFNGHGVGLSGCGATALANAGQDYISILKYYYKGVEIQKI